MASLSPSPKMQFFTANGVPLAGGKLYTYVAGGLTIPQTTYTDSSGITPNTNPIILDSRGEANVWLSDGLLYAFKLTDSLDSLIWTVDNISGELTPASLHNVTGKTTPVDLDEIPLLDSAASFILKKLTFANLKATLTAWTMSFRNIFINGAYQVSQVNEDAAVTITAGAAINYAIDQWYTQSTGQNITAQRVAGASPFKYAYKLLAGATGPTTTLHGTRIEGKDCVKLVNQTIAVQVGILCDVARQVTWTAYYANTEDTFSAKTQIATGTISATNGQANYTFTFNAGANAGNGLCIEYTTGALTNSTGFIQYQGHQLERVSIGATAGTAYEHVPYDTQLAWCQRYLPCIPAGVLGSCLGAGSAYTASAGYITVALPVTTRVPVTGFASPNIALYSGLVFGSTAAAVNSFSFNTADFNSCIVQFTLAGAVLAANVPCIIVSSNASALIYLQGAQL